MTIYERIIDLDEIGVVDGINLLLSHYRFWISGENGCILIDRYRNIIATVNLEEENFFDRDVLIIQCWWVWQTREQYCFKGDFLSPISYKKIIWHTTKM